ncbi:caspase domain-containing protein [Desarmillaria tabescens]|uniref:Caspase domain-containing protein n=1 Tax=Armillaria tabescens TaxID=1929756 RepID=A0AA39T3R5_ARMTA|nr:caspase domain-containing protein [Desarmillaria tabescens]KAK0462311.1 caspase domain-containing protein [Desarmillaria tabescens]
MRNKGNAAIRPTLVILKGLQAAGDIAPLPYIKGIAALAITVLETIDVYASTNHRDIRELVERIGDTVIAVKDAAVTYSRVGTGNGLAIEEVCTDFMRCLEDITHELRKMERNNASKIRIMQYLMTSNVRDEINGFARQVDNLQRNFNTKNIVRICANNEVSETYLRTLEHGMRELRAEHSDMHRTLTLLLVSHNELLTQVFNQYRVLNAMGHDVKRDRGERTAIVQSTFDSRYMTYYILLSTLTTTFFWTVSCFTNFLPTPLILYSQRASIRRYLSPWIPVPSSGNLVQRSKDRHAPRRKALCSGSSSTPNEEELIEAINWLASDAQRGDTLVFFYAGNGEQVSTEDDNRVDKYDEAILPVDYYQHGHILHQEIYQIMVKPLPAGCRLTVLLSCCHSEAALNLPYVYDCDTHLMSPRPLISLKSTAADVVIWSGGKGMAVHETVIGGMTVSAFNYAFLSSLKMNPKQSCRQLLHSLRNILTARDRREKPQLATSSQSIDPDLPATL